MANVEMGQRPKFLSVRTGNFGWCEMAERAGIVSCCWRWNKRQRGEERGGLLVSGFLLSGRASLFLRLTPLLTRSLQLGWGQGARPAPAGFFH